MPRLHLRTALPVAFGLALGAAVGLGLYTFVYAKGYSYLLDDPAACANCHVMNPQLDSWIKSSHHAVATCNDCHTPLPGGDPAGRAPGRLHRLPRPGDDPGAAQPAIVTRDPVEEHTPGG